MITLSMPYGSWCKLHTLLVESFYETEEDKEYLSKVFQQIVPIMQQDTLDPVEAIVEIEMEDDTFKWLKGQWENPVKPHLFAAQEDQQVMRQGIQSGFDNAQTVGVEPIDWDKVDQKLKSLNS